VKRRAFLTLLGSAAVSWPLAGRAQQQTMPMIGILSAGGQTPSIQLMGFLKRLEETGYVEGRNVAIEFRATDQYDQLPALVAELVRRQVAVIYAAGTANSALAAKAATATIPIVFANGSDPVTLGLVASMGRPGGNVTGVSFLAGTLIAKRLELLRELVPQAKIIAFLVNPANSRAEQDKADMQAAARSVGQDVVVVTASTADDIDTAFATASRQGVGGLIAGGDAFYLNRHAQLVALAARYRIPTSYSDRASAEAGGLMSYGDDRLESRRQAGLYVGRILNGEKPADLPVLQPTKFEFVINLKAAKALGITFPPSFHLRADEVIE
jgi:putative ABC transport system substrate-binding protein